MVRVNCLVSPGVGGLNATGIVDLRRSWESSNDSITGEGHAFDDIPRGFFGPAIVVGQEHCRVTVQVLLVIIQ